MAQRLTFNLHTDRTAKCPLCRTELIPDVVYWFRGIAVCEICYEQAPGSALMKAFQHSIVAGNKRCWTNQHGLSIFTPDHISESDIILWQPGTMDAGDTTDLHNDQPYAGELPGREG